MPTSAFALKILSSKRSTEGEFGDQGGVRLIEKRRSDHRQHGMECRRDGSPYGNAKATMSYCQYVPSWMSIFWSQGHKAGGVSVPLLEEGEKSDEAFLAECKKHCGMQ